MRLETHTPSSPYQVGDPPIHVLVPDVAQPGTISCFLYVLPVEALDRAEYGDALAEVAKLELVNRPDAVCVKPTFAQAPWYADHPSDAAIRQESHLLKVVLPCIEQAYGPADGAVKVRRLLLGFSKSGWGAYSLLLRHPETFQKASVFDAPLAWESPNRYGMAQVFGTQENMNRYCVVDLLARSTALAQQESRLALYGYSDFRGQHQFLHHYLLRLGIPHSYEDGPRRQHRWDSGWVKQAVEFLMS
jgi:hypothetical protein